MKCRKAGDKLLIEDIVSIKQNNLKKLITAIRFTDNLTKKDISSQTKLSIATITNLCNELGAKGAVSEGGHSPQMRAGRTPNLMKFCYDRFYVMALDFQFDDVVGIALLNLRNEICFSDSLVIPSNAGVEELIATARKRLQEAAEKLGPDIQIIGVGASIPAVYDRNDGLIKCSSIARYQNIPLKEMLKKEFGCPAYVDNCANLRAISAYAQHPASNIVCLDISQGVGGGVIIEGEVLRGKNGYATELAHIPLGDKTLKCSTCGSYGCVETNLGIENIVKQFPQIDQELPLPEKWKNCVDFLKKNSAQMEDRLDHWGRLLGQVASILINLFDPDDFYITGYITDIFPLLEKTFWEEVRARSQEALGMNLRISVKECSWSDVYIGISDAMYQLWIP